MTNTIAQTILAQLGQSKFLTMTGAHHLGATERGLQFRVSGRLTRDNINFVRIELDANDTYRVEFGRVFRSNYTVKHTVEGVYGDDLQRVFTTHTGLETSLGTMGR